MMETFRERLAPCATALLLACTALPPAALSQEAAGLWQRENGASRVRFSRCGEALCGTLDWLADAGGPAKLGQRVFYDMIADGAGKWKGSAFNPEDGKTYSGTMSLAGDRLTTAGCVLGGLICRSVVWLRVK